MVDDLDLLRQLLDADSPTARASTRRQVRERVMEQVRAAAPARSAGGSMAAGSTASEPAVSGGPAAWGGPAASAGSAPRRRRRIAAIVAVPVAGALAAAGWAVSDRYRASQVTESVACYAGPSLTSSVDVVGSTGASPVDICAAQWQAGTLGTKRAGTTGSTAPAGSTGTAGTTGPVPALAACVLPRGSAVGVFPDTTCAALHLQPLPAGYAAAARTFSAVVSQLVDELGTSGSTTCVLEARAVTLVNQALQEHGYRGWTVPTEQFSASTPCATFSPDPAGHQIVVVGQQTPGFNGAVDSATEAQRPSCAPGDRPESAAAAIRLFSRALRAAGYGDWKVVVSPGVVTTPGQPCYNPGVDQASRTIDLSSTMAMLPLPH